jgi:hypothetical protein
MITLYTLVLFIHISASFVWLGGGIVMEFLYQRIGNNATRQQLKDFFAMAAWLSPRLFAPAAILTLITGIAVVALSTKHHFSDFSVVYALVAVFAALALGAGGIGRITTRLEYMIDDPTVDQNALSQDMRRLRLVSHLDLAILITVLFDVTTDPQWNSYPFFFVVGVFLLAVLVYNLTCIPGHERHPSARLTRS